MAIDCNVAKKQVFLAIKQSGGRGGKLGTSHQAKESSATRSIVLSKPGCTSMLLLIIRSTRGVMGRRG